MKTLRLDNGATYATGDDGRGLYRLDDATGQWVTLMRPSQTHVCTKPKSFRQVLCRELGIEITRTVEATGW